MIIYLAEIQSEARGSKIGMMKVHSYKSIVILELIYDTLHYCTWLVLDGNVLQILGHSDMPQTRHPCLLPCGQINLSLHIFLMTLLRISLIYPM